MILSPLSSFDRSEVEFMTLSLCHLSMHLKLRCSFWERAKTLSLVEQEVYGEIKLLSAKV